MKDIEDIYLFVAERIKLARKQARMTQEDLAEKIKVSRTALVNMEGRKQRILIHHLFEIARITGVEISYFFPDSSGDELKNIQNIAVTREERKVFDRSVSKIRKTIWTVLSELDELDVAK